ncbi:S-4TM family putative pore-forming effector [Streptomyces hydrogenans]|uniref:S-4TM family putative pore-forming effector n=1 Tax=Streptomyces hydrogenans TaxID=1873719 RepID=UPI0033B37C89
MNSFTDPPIWESQNSEGCLRLLSAQRQTYSDAKILHFVRVSVVIFSGAGAAILTLSVQSFRPVVGAAAGFFLLVLSLASSAREKRKIESAAAMQEVFDTTVFRLPRSMKVKISSPSAAEVARASLRHKGKGLENWYGIESRVARPLDVLICQRANLGWGIVTHRSWAAVNLWFGILLILAATIASIVTGLTLLEAALGVYAPLVPTFKEVAESWIKNQQSANTKEGLESIADKLWSSSMRSGKAPSESQCRKLQDGILESRMSGVLIPDWFNRFARKREEEVMRLSATDYVEQSAAAGF